MMKSDLEALLDCIDEEVIVEFPRYTAFRVAGYIDASEYYGLFISVPTRMTLIVDVFTHTDKHRMNVSVPLHYRGLLHEPIFRRKYVSSS